jgi:hypothetical protein
MTKTQQIKNIIAFLSILFGESKLWYSEIMNFSPDYLIEKFNRYINSTKSESDWGLHPSLRATVFEAYCRKYSIPFIQYQDIE